MRNAHTKSQFPQRVKTKKTRVKFFTWITMFRKNFTVDISSTCFLWQLLFESAAKFNVSRRGSIRSEERGGGCGGWGEIKTQLQRVAANLSRCPRRTLLTARKWQGRARKNFYDRHIMTSPGATSLCATFVPRQSDDEAPAERLTRRYRRIAQSYDSDYLLKRRKIRQVHRYVTEVTLSRNRIAIQIMRVYDSAF